MKGYGKLNGGYIIDIQRIEIPGLEYFIKTTKARKLVGNAAMKELFRTGVVASRSGTEKLMLSNRNGVVEHLLQWLRDAGILNQIRRLV